MLGLLAYSITTGKQIPRFHNTELAGKFDLRINAYSNEILERLKEEGKILLKIIMLALNRISQSPLEGRFINSKIN